MNDHHGIRLDLFLKTTHLIGHRELAKEMCEEGMVRVNGVPRMASAEISVGDVLAFPVFNRLLKVKVLSVPKGNLPKGSQWSCVEILEEKRFPAEGPSTLPQKAPNYH